MIKDFNIQIKKVGNILYIKNNGLPLYIIPECMFETKGIHDLPNNKSMTLSLNKTKKEHKDFINIINEIYNKCSEHIESDNDFNPDIIMNPLIKINDIIYNLHLFVTSWNGNDQAIFYDDNNDLINLKDLEDKTFSIYPAINVDRVSLNKSKDKAYINILLKEGFINNIKNKRLLDFEKYKTYINKNKSLN